MLLRALHDQRDPFVVVVPFARPGAAELFDVSSSVGGTSSRELQNRASRAGSRQSIVTLVNRFTVGQAVIRAADLAADAARVGSSSARAIGTPGR